MPKSKKKYEEKYGGNVDMYWESAAYAQQLFYCFRDQAISLALSRYKWINLPPRCDARYIEWQLLMNGMCTIAFPRSMKGQFFSTQAVTQSEPNIYDNPTKWLSVGNNGWRFKVTARNGVLVYDNVTRFPLIAKIDVHVKELVDIMRTAQLNRMHQKVPFILKGSQDQMLDMVNIYKQIAGGEPAIIANKGIQNISVEAIMTDVPYLGSELQEAFLAAWNNLYMLLGIANIPFKMERQIESEVKTFKEPSTLAALNGLECRRRACDELNRRFTQYLDAPVSVVWNSDCESDNYNLIHTLSQQLEATGGDLIV